MGQYYRPALLDEQMNVTGWLLCYDFDNGAKLMEHSYMQNEFMDAVGSMIVDQPKRVAWIGDYSNDPWEGTEEYQKIPQDMFEKVYNSVWGEDSEKTQMNPTEKVEFGDYTGWYLVNHTSKEFLDMHEVFMRCGQDVECTDGTKVRWCVHPLSLLTACGNGRGGGNYYYKDPDEWMVGMWAFDKVQMTQKEPEGYEQLYPEFKES